jgi:hypothetical protein
MGTASEKRTAEELQQVIQSVCQNLGLNAADLLADPSFRKEIGVDDLGEVEKQFLREEAAE